MSSIVRNALLQGFEGEVHELLRLPYTLAESLPQFSVVAAVALEMSVEKENESEGVELARLAVDLLTVEGRTRALNLNARAQMVSSLMKWYRELDH